MIREATTTIGDSIANRAAGAAAMVLLLLALLHQTVFIHMFINIYTHVSYVYAHFIINIYTHVSYVYAHFMHLFMHTFLDTRSYT